MKAISAIFVEPRLKVLRLKYGDVYWSELHAHISIPWWIHNEVLGRKYKFSWYI